MKKKILVMLVMVMIVIGISSAVLGVIAQTPFDRTNMPAQLKCTAVGLNVRSGPGTYFTKVGVISRGQIVDCLGKIGSWYVVHLKNNTVGLASGMYLQPYYPPNSQPAPTPKPQPPAATPAPGTGTTDGTINPEAQKMLDLINGERAKTGASALQIDKKVVDVANLKAQDMVSKSYFSHTSPTYGSPFDMLKQFGISYNYAGENLAGNSTVEKAHTALMNSEGHRKNILNKNYNYIGIGIADSPTYGKIYVQMFIGK